MTSDATKFEYYNNVRPEVLALVPAEARRVLDVGCGTGQLGASIKRRQPCEVTGIEVLPDVGARAVELLDRVLIGDGQGLLAGFEDASFDCIVMADSLEHMVETDKVLAHCRRLLRAEGTLVVSLPNIRHWSTVLMLLTGRWDYAEFGIMDRTHMRFFTIPSAIDLLKAHGFEHQEITATKLNNENLLARHLPAEVFARFDGLREESDFFQFVIQARRT